MKATTKADRERFERMFRKPFATGTVYEGGAVQ